jgi:hypothetical protein
MKINLSPQRRDDPVPTVSVKGTTLKINDDELNLSEIPNGATLNNAEEVHPLLTGTIENRNGQYELTMILPHGSDPIQAQAFPEAINITTGKVDLPQNTYQETTQEETPDGSVTVTVTTYVWHEEPTQESYVIPAPAPADEE